MTHRTELNTQISTLTGISKHTIDRIGVNLNKGGLLLAGGRGRHAPHMGSEDLKNILLALLGSESSGKVFETVLKLHALAAEDGRCTDTAGRLPRPSRRRWPRRYRDPDHTGHSAPGQLAA